MGRERRPDITLCLRVTLMTAELVIVFLFHSATNKPGVGAANFCQCVLKVLGGRKTSDRAE